MDNVTLGILSPQNSVYSVEETEIYKSFGLQPIRDVHGQFNSGKEIYFLNSNNQPVKVSSITKVPYKDKIYDVDVANDIVLVRRGGLEARAFWSGNLNNGTVYGNATPTTSGRFLGAESFDGDGDYINAREKSPIVKILTIQLYLEHLENPLRIFSVLNWRLVLRFLPVLTKPIPETEGFVINNENQIINPEKIKERGNERKRRKNE